MERHWGAGIAAWLIAVFCALTGPDGNTIYVAPDNVQAVLSEPGVGKAPTAVITNNNTLYVRESVATVIARLRGARQEEQSKDQN